MSSRSSVLICVLLFLGVSLASKGFAQRTKLTPVYRELDKVEKIFQKAKLSSIRQNVEYMSVECGVCGIVVNEIEGFASENITVNEIEGIIQRDVCSLLSGSLLTICDDLVQDIPQIIDSINNTNSVSIICVNYGYCEAPFTPHTDPVPLPKFVVNLDLPPEQRLTEICTNPVFQNITQYLIGSVQKVFPLAADYLADIGNMLNTFYFPNEYSREISSCAESLGVPAGWLALFNMGYEISDACTSILAQTNDGKILHARNMDFWDGMGFTNSLKEIAIEIEYQKGGQTFFHATGFAGYVGVLSGLKPNAFSLTVDTRFYPQGLSELFYEVIASITERNASLVTFLTRKVLTEETNWSAAVTNLSTDELIADVYYIVAGVDSGAIISRNRLNASDVWVLDPSAGRWFEVETNYDHWKPAPWFDDRITPANNAMQALGRNSVSLDGMFKVLTVKPVLNLQTTYSILACPADGTYQSFARYCPYPCVE